MRKRKRSWLLRPLVLGLAVTAIAAPSAQAAPHEGADLSGGSANAYLNAHDRPKIGPPIRYGQAVQQSVNPSSFDWSDAGVVAGLGLVLLSFGAVHARRRTGQAATV